MKHLPMIPILQPLIVIVGLGFQLHTVHAQERSLGEMSRPALVITNKGQVTEYYGSPGNSAVITYSEITNDVPMVQVVRTNWNGRIFDCLLMASQLKAAPKWDPEKAAPPLSPRRARLIAVEQAFKDLGPSNNNVFDIDLIHHWQVVNCELVQGSGWWDRDFVWYYKVGVKRVVMGSSPGIPDAEILITMDGKAAPYVQRRVAGTAQR